MRTGVSQNSAHNSDSKCFFALCCLLVKDCISTLNFMFEGFFFKTNYEKVKTLFHFARSKMLFCSMFAIEPDSLNSNSCSTLN